MKSTENTAAENVTDNFIMRFMVVLSQATGFIINGTSHCVEMDMIVGKEPFNLNS